MSYHYAFEPDRNRVRVTIEGTLDDDVLADAFRAIYTDPAHVPGMHELTDCRRVDRITMTRDGVHRLVDVVTALNAVETPYRVAIIAPADTAIFGMARMYELLQDESNEEVRVFRSLEEGERFTETGGDD